ncbi:MAG: rhamnogalacturonan acetylesterase [Pseudomonadota bacterium]
MKTILALIAAALIALPVAAADKPVRLILVGDSTMAQRTGYGDALCQRLAASLTCINLAKGGRSSSSFRAEGRWDEVQALLRDRAAFSATYVLIQFGHNDQPGKPGRSTDLVTEYPANLARYAREASALGALPVLVTPLTRRTFAGPNLKNDLAPWAAATRTVAQAEHTLLLDLNDISYSAVQAMGQAEADTLAMDTPPSAFDRTHLGPKGAAYFANMVAAGLAKAVPALAKGIAP